MGCPHREAGDAECGCFFMHAVAVGEDHFRSGDQAEEGQVAHGLGGSDAVVKLYAVEEEGGARDVK